MRLRLIALYLLPLWAVSPCVATSSPHILMILVDDLGYGDLACMGAPDLRTPQVDHLMEAGLRWDRFYANCPVCSPTRAALLTGRYPDLAGVPGVIRTHQADSWGYLKAELPLLPAILKRAGYHCAMVGKWHLGLTSPNTPWERGFERFRGFLGDMMDDYWTHRRHGHNYMVEDGRRIDPEGHATDLFTRWACEFIESRRDDPQPFFLYLAYNAPHAPIQPPPDWLRRVRQREAGISEKRAKLVALIEHLDDGIGRVLTTLERTGLADRTLIVFTSDNGGALAMGANNGRLRGGKQQMWEGGLRVPACMVWPGHILPGRRETERVALTMDLLPSLCAAAGVAPPGPVDGRSLLPIWRDAAAPWPVRTLFWMRREGGAYGGRVYYAVRRGRTKLLQNTATEPMQYVDLESDEAEQHPTPGASAITRDLITRLRDHINRAGAVPWAPDPVRIDAEYPGP